VIFDTRRSDEQTDIRKEVVEVVAQMTPALGFEPNVNFTGDFGDGLSNEIIGELIPIVREALTNVAKHADASMAEVRLEIGDALQLSVIDDGHGIDSGAPRGYGLGNITRRAVLLGGELKVRVVPEGGTELLLKVPLQDI
jgi:two-component system sensor histidine kinase DevS